MAIRVHKIERLSSGIRITIYEGCCGRARRRVAYTRRTGSADWTTPRGRTASGSKARTLNDLAWNYIHTRRREK